MSEDVKEYFGDLEHPNRPRPWPAPPADSTTHKTPNCIDLAQPRKIVIRQGSTLVAYLVKPISQALWFKYFDSIVSTAERDRTQVVQNFDATSAGIDLVDAALTGGTNEPAISLAHRLALANVLTSAYVPDEDSSSIEAGLGPEAVRLHAIWSAFDGETMRRHKNLVHWFEAPTAEQNRRYRRDDSRSQIIGGSRKGTTVYHGAQRTLAALYDELIVSVAGYAVNGVALEGREEIARHMDTYHKVAAAARLFAPAEIAIEEDEE